jgi:antitoxin (DNA-binding transcriptional repressor) of toxin-antitoxin stability system
MRKVTLDKAAPAVKKFFRALKIGNEGVEVVLNGEVVYKVVPASQMSEAEKQAMLERTWKLINRARERNKGVPARVIAREVRDAIDEVRRRQRK